MPARIGLDAALRRGTVGAAIGTTTVVNNVKDLTLSMEKGEADITTRGGSGWRATLGTLKEATLEFTMNLDVSDPDFDAFHAAFFGNTNIALAVLDFATGEGVLADWTVTGFSIEQPLEEAQTVNVTCKPTFVTRAPVWHTPA